MRHQPISPASPAGLSQPSPHGGRIVQNQMVLVSVTESAADAMNNVTTRPAAADVEWLTAVFLGSFREAITAARGTWDEVNNSISPARALSTSTAESSAPPCRRLVTPTSNSTRSASPPNANLNALALTLPEG